MRRPDSLLVIVLLTGLVALGPVSTDLYLPSLPSLAIYFAAEVGEVQLTLSVFLVGFAAGQLIYGPLSDRYGRRPVLIGGIAVYIAAGLACAVAPTIETLIAARFFQALGACVGPVLGRAVVRDVFGQAQAATVISYMSFAMAVAPAVGPIIGGYLEVWFGWRSAFVALAVLGTAALAGVAALLPETNPWRDPGSTRVAGLLRNYRLLLKSRRYRGFLLIFASAYSGIFAFISGSSFVLIGTVGLSPNAYGLAFAAIVVGFMAGALGSGRLTARLGVERMAMAGAFISLAGGVAAALAAFLLPIDVPSVVIPVFVFMIGTGLMLPNAMMGAIGPFPRMAGTASSLLGFTQMTLAALVGIAVGQASDGTPVAMNLAILAVSALAVAAYWGLVRGTSDDGA